MAVKCVGMATIAVATGKTSAVMSAPVKPLPGGRTDAPQNRGSLFAIFSDGLLSVPFNRHRGTLEKNR